MFHILLIIYKGKFISPLARMMLEEGAVVFFLNESFVLNWTIESGSLFHLLSYIGEKDYDAV